MNSTTAMRFVDTNVLLYSISTEPAEAAKTSTAHALMASRDLALSVQVLQEFYVQATRTNRKHPLSHDEALAYICTWRRFPIQDVTISVLDDALSIKARYQLSYWDSAIIAAAKQAQCHEILSEDMNDGQDYGGIKVLNPFKS
jgi:predicted nucleic acid-binding protein